MPSSIFQPEPSSADSNPSLAQLRADSSGDTIIHEPAPELGCMLAGNCVPLPIELAPSLPQSLFATPVLWSLQNQFLIPRNYSPSHCQTSLPGTLFSSCYFPTHKTSSLLFIEEFFASFSLKTLSSCNILQRNPNQYNRGGGHKGPAISGYLISPMHSAMRSLCGTLGPSYSGRKTTELKYQVKMSLSGW